MTTRFTVLLLAVTCSVLFISTASAQPAERILSGEPKQWHKVTLTVDGPQANETDTNPNPFLDYRMTVFFHSPSPTQTYRIPGYFAADGDAANSHAASGNKWRAHFAPDKPGRWRYCILF